MLNLGLDVLVFLIPILVYSLVLHEFAHAASAAFLGDNTPGKDGRLSLNPLVHLDLFGGLALLLIGFGWAKPVRINPANLRHPLRDDIIISIAGPLTNVLIALIAFILLLVFEPEYGVTFKVLWFTYKINLILAIFNALPFYPLDGSHIVISILKLTNQQSYAEKFQKYSGYIFLILIALDFATDISIFRPLIVFVSDFFEQFLGV